MSVVPVIRLITFISSIVCSLIVLGIAAHMTWFEEVITTLESYDDYSIVFIDPFISLSLATSALTILAIAALLVLGCVQVGAIVIVELSTVSVLWVLWLAAAGLTAKNRISNCGFFSEGDPSLLIFCYEVNVLSGFSFLTWLALVSYAVILLVFTLIASSRGKNVWTASVNKTNFLEPSAAIPPVDGGGIPPKYEYYPQAYYPPNISPLPPQAYMTPQPMAYPPSMYAPPLPHAGQPFYPAYQAASPLQSAPLNPQQSPPLLPQQSPPFLPQQSPPTLQPQGLPPLQ